MNYLWYTFVYFISLFFTRLFLFPICVYCCGKFIAYFSLCCVFWYHIHQRKDIPLSRKKWREIVYLRSYLNNIQRLNASPSVLTQWYVPKMRTCGSGNANYCITGRYKLVWNSDIEVSIITKYFCMYSFVGGTEAGSRKYKWKILSIQWAYYMHCTMWN